MDIHSIFMILPLIIAATAIGITLIYASLLDVKQRRVPFRTWYPMLAVSIPMAAFFYGFYVLRLNEILFFQYTLFFAGLAILLTAIDYIYTLTRSGEKPPNDEIVAAGIFWLVLSLPLGSVAMGWFLLGIPDLVYYSLFICAFCGVCYAFAILNLYGGADAFALIFIAACVPFFPVEPFLGYPQIAFFPLTILLNAVLFSFLAPLGIFFLNLSKRHKAPLRYLFVGYPVDGNEIENAFGVVMEEFWEEEGELHRRFIPFSEAIFRMFRGEKRVVTQHIKRQPELYSKEIALYRHAGEVWISYGVPFIIPITAGFITAIFLGDLFFTLLGLLNGV